MVKLWKWYRVVLQEQKQSGTIAYISAIPHNNRKAEKLSEIEEKTQSQSDTVNTPFTPASSAYPQQPVAPAGEKPVVIEKTADGGGAKGLVRDILIMIPIVIIVVVLLKAFVFGTYEIPSGSMIDTIEIGDRVISEKITYLTREPVRGEIVTFKDPTNPERTLIKRVIATGGETVSMTPDGHVTINGEILDEPYVDGKESNPLANTAKPIAYPYEVPEGEMWVMGDNRTSSQDSRYFGSVPISSVTGHAVITYWPPDRIGTL